jgi:hypothetical protein
MIERLQRARDAIDDPALHPPPPTDRNLAEGYRYLLGFVFGAIERAFHADPEFPSFRRAIQPADKSTIDNADAMYLTAPIDGSRTYRVTGRPGVRKPPQYVIFEAHNGYAGDSGSIAELKPGTRSNTGKLDSSTIDITAPFEILLAPSRPEGHEGHFIATMRTSARTGTTYVAEHLSMRVLFGDWANEDPLELRIERVGQAGEHPPPLDPETCARMLRRTAEIVDNQMRFWNEFYAVVLGTYAEDGYMPHNSLNDPSPADLATGGGQSTNVYAGGVYDLGPDEALVIEVRVPVEPQYQSLHLSNLWGESHDYANHVSSLNGHQVSRDPDGAIRYVIAHRDPGVPNWLDTTGLETGFMSYRWTYSVLPDELPATDVKKVVFDDIRAALPAGARVVTLEERREQIRVRQEHVQRRFRQY